MGKQANKGDNWDYYMCSRAYTYAYEVSLTLPAFSRNCYIREILSDASSTSRSGEWFKSVMEGNTTYVSSQNPSSLV